MFSNELDRSEFPLAARGRGIALGSIVMVTVAAALVSARTLPFLLGLTVVSFLADAAMRGALDRVVPRRGPVFWHLAIFLLYAALSTAWALEPKGTFLVVSMTILVGLGTLVLVQLLPDETRPNLLHMGEGVWLGFIVALVYLCVELTSDQSIKIWVYNAVGIKPGELPHPEYFAWSTDHRLTYISPEDLTRNMAPGTTFLWPAVMAMIGALPRQKAIFLASATILLAGVVVMMATHETSKLAFVAGLVAFGCAMLSPLITGRIVAAVWVAACLAVLPFALTAHRLDAHNASWLQPTARHRIIIWNYTAEQVLQAPLLGVGARTTYVLGPLLERENATRPDEAFRRTLSVHSHSVYLQTWFELGLVGAALLTLLGLSILQAIRSLASQLQPYAYATFVSAAVMAGSSYGMWQIWFVAMFGLSAALFALGAALMRARPSHAAQP